MRNVNDTCSECGRRIPPGAPVAIVHTWRATGRVWRLTGNSERTRVDHWVCLDCAQANHEFENKAIAEVGRCKNCGREIRHWELSERLPSACCAECRRLAGNKRSCERRRVEHEPKLCVVCGEMFTPQRNDAKTCGSKCRQKLYRHTEQIKDEPILSHIDPGVTLPDRQVVDRKAKG
jgi:hypothetical protein